jgi:predicted metalloprotease with PDZ domain
MPCPKSHFRPGGLIVLAFVALGAGMSASRSLAQAPPIVLRVDATDVARRILHAQLEFPVRPGELTLVYPKWIPGEHGPTGPINDLTGIQMSAAGKLVAWRRDDIDMYAFHLTLPPGVSRLQVDLDFLLASGQGQYSAVESATAQLLDLAWNQVLLYPKGARADAVEFAATLRLPPGWKAGTALPLAGTDDDSLQFAPVTLERLVDSPLIAGRYFRTVELSPGQTPPHYIHIVADSEAALDMKPADIAHFRQLVAETGALFGARHYRGYHFLLTLSDHVAHFGLEHHESSDNRVDENFLTDEKIRKLEAELMPHEMVHSWNGKYRRPAGLATPDYQQPMKDELLWVYEGLTEYWGEVLAARSGLWTNEDFREALALTAAGMQDQAGRKWRPLLDTTVAAPILYEAPAPGTAWRRSVDFYPEGALLWLEADTVIRQQSHGRRTLDDFCNAFYGGKSGPPEVVPYSLDDVLEALNRVAPYDWRGFFQQRVFDLAPRAPLGGIENSGWRLAYTNKPPDLFASRETERKITDLRFSLGLIVKEDGSVVDVIPGSPADLAGIGPNVKLVAINGRRWTPELLRVALESARTNTAPLELLVDNADYFKTCPVTYHQGNRYPVLERDPSHPDMLSEILKPRAPAPAAGGDEH